MFRLKVFQHGNEVRELLIESGREYTFGRGENCDVQLEKHQGISRVHFKIYEENGQWMAQVMSKFGDIQHSGQPVQTLTLDVGTVFQLPGYSFQFLEIAREQVSASSTLPATIDPARADEGAFGGAIASGGEAMPPPGFAGNDEATRVANAAPEAPFLRIIYPDAGEEIIKLDGRRWTAGREEGVDVLLNDRKASRRQFELSSTPQGYFVRDLGSSNGTLLNGVVLASDELKAIRSGDVIQVGRVVIHFEVRDPDFTKRLMVVAPHAMSDHPIVVESPYEMINYPVVSGPGGAVRVDQAGLSGQLMARIDHIPVPFAERLDEEKKRKVRFWILAAAVLIPLVGIMMLFGDDKPSKPQPKANMAFEKLSPKQQQQVKETYVLALNLYMQSKLALAGGQLQSLHQILPEGYENSIAMAAECEKQADIERTLREIEDQRRRQEEIRRTVEKTIRDCEPISQKSSQIDEINRCLRAALDLDPENSMVKELIGRVQRRIEQKRLSEIEKREFAARAAKGKALFQRAQALELESEFLDALEAYRKHAASPYPDPEDLKEISQRQIISLTKKMGSRVEESLKAAEAAFALGKFREALDNVMRAKRYDPTNQRAAEMNAKFRRDINMKMREIYEEAIISEGLGSVPDAKARWQKIIDTDHPEGEYYKKARNKLRSYGNF